jgi:short-subunit dehydrogenase
VPTFFAKGPGGVPEIIFVAGFCRGNFTSSKPKAMKPNHPLAVITGASSGIGKVFAEEYAARGYDLLIAGRDKTRLENVASSIRVATGVRVETITGDLGTAGHREELSQRIRLSGRADVLVNNAGFGLDKPFHRMGSAEILSMIGTHNLAMVELTSAALPGMKARGRGTIINVSSLASFLPGLCRTTYLATKAFMHQFSLGMSLELAHYGIRVQSLCPGFVKTNFQKAMMAGSLEKKYEHMNFMEPEEVVSSSLKSLENGKVLCIPGRNYYFYYLLSRILPLSLFRKISRFRNEEQMRTEPVSIPMTIALPAA